MKNATLAAVGLSLSSLLFSASSQATIIAYTDLSAFQAAAGSTVTEDFSSSALGTSTSNFAGSFNGFDISSISNGDNVGIANSNFASAHGTNVGAPYYGQNFFGWGNGNGGTAPTTTFSFAPGVTAFGFEYFNNDPTDSYNVLVNGHTSVIATSGVGFLGFIATGETISTATISTRDAGGYIGTVGIDNVLSSGTVSAPTTLALIGLGLFGLGVTTRQRKSS